MGSLEIVVTESPTGKLRASPRSHRGETVTWIFKGKLAGKNLAVFRKEKDGPITLFATPEPEQPNQISGQPFPGNGREGEEDFEYVIVDMSKREEPLPWATGDMGECIKHPGPPSGGRG